MPGSTHKRFAGKACVLCRIAPSSPTGEHVIPRWYIRDARGEKITTDRNGKPIRRNRGGEVHTTDGLTGAHLPMCKSCNGVLGTRFEQTTRHVIRRLRDAPACRLDAADTRLATLWLMKVMLLIDHPEVRWDNPYVDEARDPWPDTPARLLDWMTNGSEPPTDDLTCFLTVEDPALSAPPRRSRVAVVGQATSFGVGPHVRSTLVHHRPDDRPNHPYVVTGQAVQLWPAPPSLELDLTAIRPSPSAGFSWLRVV